MPPVEPTPAVGESPEANAFRPVTGSRRHLPPLVGAAALLLLAALLQVTPAGDGVTLFGHRLPESCLVKRTSGSRCPGCGLTRSFVSGVRLDPASFRFHPLGPLLLVLVAAQLPYRGYRLWRSEPAQDAEPRGSGRLALGVVGGLIAALVGVWLGRQGGWLP